MPASRQLLRYEARMQSGTVKYRMAARICLQHANTCYIRPESEKAHSEIRDAVDTPTGGYTDTIVFGLSITSSIIANQNELFFFAKKILC